MTRSLLRLTALAALTSFAWNAQASVAQDINAGLDSNSWQLVSMGHDAIDTNQPRLVLGANGSVSGSTGCNIVKATYQADGSDLTFGPIGTTRKYCAAVWQTEHAFLMMLEDVRGYEVENGTLTLTGGNGEALATFRAN